MDRSYEWVTLWAVGLCILVALLVSLPVGLGSCGEVVDGPRRGFCDGPRWIGLFLLPPVFVMIGGMVARKLERWSPLIGGCVLGTAAILATAVLASSLPRIPS
jgi:hypothetical protein